MNFLKKVFRSNKFFGCVIFIYLIQALFYAVAVEPSYIEAYDGHQVRTGGVVPDGNRHIGAIYYFANKPILAPISHMDSHDLWLGDLVRFPSYLYYFVLSFAVKLLLFFGVSDILIVFLIRLIGILFGLACLILIRKIAQKVSDSRAVANLSALALTLTGSFVYLAPAENYDIFALMFFLLFINSLLEIFKNHNQKQIYWATIWLLLGSIAKYTYFPFMSLFAAGAFLNYVWQNKPKKQSIFKRKTWLNLKLFKPIPQEIKRFYRSDRLKFWLASLLLLVSFGMFSERIIGNLVMFKSVNPTCTKIHPHDECMNFGVYERDYSRSEFIKNNPENFVFKFNDYVKTWFIRYYYSMFIYLGQSTFLYDDQFHTRIFVSLRLVAAVAAVMIIWLKLKRVKILQNNSQKGLVLMVAVLVLAQFLFNMTAFIKYDGMLYAHQGRYLLSAIVFVYILLAILGQRFYQEIGKKWSKTFAVSLILFMMVIISNISAPKLFYEYANSPDWYSDFAKSFLPDWFIKHQ